jgi:hypothetical protein
MATTAVLAENAQQRIGLGANASSTKHARMFRANSVSISALRQRQGILKKTAFSFAIVHLLRLLLRVQPEQQYSLTDPSEACDLRPR